MKVTGRKIQAAMRAQRMIRTGILPSLGLPPVNREAMTFPQRTYSIYYKIYSM